MSGARYRVTDPRAPRRAPDAAIGQIAEAIRGEVRSATPRDTGNLAESWTVQKGANVAVRLVRNPVYYGRFVEYGTKNMRANPALGRTLARYRSRYSR